MIKIIDYKAGNAPSVAHAVKRLGYNCELVNCASGLKNASHIILPGVGSAKATMDSLKELKLIPILEQAVLKDKIPFLGICVGLQVLFDYSQEGSVDCLGWLKGKVVKFDNKKVRVPQMGYNKVTFSESPITKKGEGHYMYFVNSYYAEVDLIENGELRMQNCGLNSDSCSQLAWGMTNYGVEFTSAVNRGNIFATQFHIEKSGEAGLNLLDKFLKLKKGDFNCG